MVGILRTSFSGENLQNIAAKTLVVTLMPSPQMVRKVFLRVEEFRTMREMQHLPRESASNIWKNEKIISEKEDT